MILNRTVFSWVVVSLSALLWSCSPTAQREPGDLVLHYQQPAGSWNEALPVGNGRMGAMVFGSVPLERIQFNEETLWTGAPNDYSQPGASLWLDTIRQLLFDGRQADAELLAMDHFMSIPLRQTEYQPFGDLYLEFQDHEEYTDYSRSLDLANALCQTRYKVKGITYSREVFASHPAQAIVIRLTANERRKLGFSLWMDAVHEHKQLSTEGNTQTLKVAVKDGVLRGTALLRVETDGIIEEDNGKITISDGAKATIVLTAATNFVDYKDVSGDPDQRASDYLADLGEQSWKDLRQAHIRDYQSLFDRFRISFGESDRDTLPMDQRLHRFNEDPVDPALIALYVQYGRYLMISSSRQGTGPANLQGIWNQDIQPAWGSKYTTNINTEMNYWPAELTQLGECHEPLFALLEDCAETGQQTAFNHYGAGGWILHHNTDLWRGTAPINHANHGIWMGGSGWLVHHLWEHYQFTQDTVFLRDRAWPLMREAARFYSQVLVEDPQSGYLISTPSNSPEIGGLVAGPTMDHQIIRSLFEKCVQVSEITGLDPEFAAMIRDMIPHIAPNQTGRLGQLQEWMEDKDNPEEKHRHVSHLWGVHPGDDITWEKNPDLMEAARRSLIFRGDEGTGWSLAWKINFWARFMDGDHAYELIKLLFRVKDDTKVNWGGGSYINLFDAHPPFQIDGNFGAPAGIVELLIQSHQGFIDVLPALPGALPEGAVNGVCARGAFVLDFEWTNGSLTRLRVLSKAGQVCRIRYQGKETEFVTKAGNQYEMGKDFAF